MKAILKILIVLIVLSGQALAIDCFTGAHNLVWRSEALTNASYWAQRSTIVADSSDVSWPQDFNSGRVWKMTATTNTEWIYANTGYYYQLTGTDLVISTYVKYSNHQWVGLGLHGSGGDFYWCAFDIQNGVNGTSNNVVSCSITAKTDGWYKITTRITGHSTNISKSVRPVLHMREGASGGTLHTGTSTEIVYVANIQGQYYIDGSTEFDKYIPNNTDYAAWGTPRICASTFYAGAIDAAALATDAVNEVREGILTRVVEGNYGATTIGGYIEKIKNYVANKMTKSGSTYTIYKNDESTVYQTGTTSGAGRDPS